MLKHSTFLVLNLCLSLVGSSPPVFSQVAGPLTYQSAFLRLELAKDQPAFVALAVDSLGKAKLSVNPLLKPAAPLSPFKVSRNGQSVEYRADGAPLATPPAWVFETSARQISLHSSYGGKPVPSMVMDFDLQLCHATLLGLMNEDGSVRLPALLHLPDHGTFRITSSIANPPALAYDALRLPKGQRENDYVKVTIPAASADAPEIDYTLEGVEIHPGPP